MTRYNNPIYYFYRKVLFLFMFRREREFNIISGQTAAYPSQRSSANLEKIRRFESAEMLPQKKTERLGYSKDHKEYQYSYETLLKQQIIKTEQPSRMPSQLPQSMLNSVSTNYNIVNMRAQIPTAKIIHSDLFVQKLPQVNRKSPLTAHIQAGRLFASNYHPEYAERVANHEFLRKKGLCDSICENQKNYGMTYFRVLK